MDVIIKRKEVLNYCEQVNLKNDEIQKSNNHILIKKMSEQIANRAYKIKDICNSEKYDLFFNGKVGIGKSTIICTIFGLINYEALKKDNRLADCLLLKTGSGRTTVCETKIVPNSDISEIEIDEVSYDEFCIYLKEFIESLFKKSSTISSEMINVIKNMAGIPLTLKEDEFLQKNQDDKKLFQDLEQKINYKNRTKKIFTFYGGKFEEWLKEIFIGINDGKFEDVPIPKKITIKICENDFQLKIPKFINSIVDTRGLDGGERPDIQSYIREDNSISFMCDGIKEFGSDEILSILEQILIEEEKDKQSRVVLLGMEKDYELDNITNFENNRDGGIKFKKEQAIKKINDKKIKFDERNYLFFSTIPGINIYKNKIFEFDKTILEKTQKEFIKKIECLIYNMYSKYSVELFDSLSLLEKLNQGEVTNSTLKKINKSFENVQKIMDEFKNNVNSNILSEFDVAIKSIYHSSLRGAVNHNGVGNTADVYGSFKKCSGDDFQKKCKEYKIKVINTIEFIFENCSELEKICLEYIRSEIDFLYQKYYEKYVDLTYSETYNKLYNNNSWAASKNYWGDGLGSYNLRVWNNLSKEIKNNKIDEILDNKDNKIQFFHDILNLLRM